MSQYTTANIHKMVDVLNNIIRAAITIRNTETVFRQQRATMVMKLNISRLDHTKYVTG